MTGDDPITKSLEAAFDKLEAGESAPAIDSVDAPPPAPASEAPPKDAGRARDDAGKFAKADKPKGGDANNAAAGTSPLSAVDKTQPPQVGAQQPNAGAVPPPQNWKGAGKMEWGRLPQHVQKAIADDYAETNKASSELNSYRSAIGERAQPWAAQYGSVENGLKSILAGADMANQNPTGFILWLAQRAGIDLTRLVQGSGQGVQQHQPTHQPNPMEQKVLGLENQLQGFLQQQQQTQRTQLQSEIDAFSSDSKHPYFNDVRSRMGELIGKGQAKTLQDAYDMTCWTDPQIREALIKSQKEDAAKANAAKVAQAKRAAVSISGSPAGGKSDERKPKRSLEETLSDRYDELAGAS